MCGKLYEVIKRVVVIAIFLGVTKFGISQTYRAEYKCIFNNLGKIDNLRDTSFESHQPSEILPLSLVLKYTVVCNKKFLEVIGEVDSSIYPKNIVVNFFNFKAIFDLTNNLVYFPDENTIKKMLVYDLAANDLVEDECFEYSVRGFDSSIRVTTCKEIPNYILPAIKFKNHEGGVKFIGTSKLSIKLVGFKRINGNLDYTKLFLPYLKKEIPETYSFF